MKGIIVLIYALMLASTSCSKKKGPASNSYINSPSPVTDNSPIGGDDTNINNPGNEGDTNTGNDQDGDNGQNDGNQGDDNQGNDGNTDGNENPRTDVYYPENGQKEFDNCYGGFKVVNGEKLKCGTHVKTRIFTVTDCNKCEEEKITTKVIEKKHRKVKRQKKQKVKKVKKQKVKKEKKQKVKKVKKEKTGPGFWERIFGKKEKKVKKEKKQKVKKEKLQKKKKVKKQKEPKVKKEKKQKVKKEKLQKKKKIKLKKEKKQKVKKVKVKEEKLQKKKVKKEKVKKEKKQKVKKIKKVKVKKKKIKKEKKQKEPVIIEKPRDPETPIVVTPKPIVLDPPVIEVPVIDIKPIVIDEPKEETRDKKANPAELVEGITSEFGVESDNLDVDSVRNNSLALNLLKTRFKNASTCTLKKPLAAKDFVKLNAKGYPVDLNKTVNIENTTVLHLEAQSKVINGVNIEISSLFADVLSVRATDSKTVFDTNPREVMVDLNGTPLFDYESYKVTPGTTVPTFLHKATTIIRDANGNKIGARKVTVYFTKDEIKGLEYVIDSGAIKATYCIID